MANKLNSEQIETIIDYYVNKEHTLASIQRELGFAPTTSRKYLVKNGIEIKSSAYQTNLKRKKEVFEKYIQ